MPNRTIFIPGTTVDLVLLEEADATVTHHWFNDRCITRFLARGAWPMTAAASAAHYKASADAHDRIVLGIWHKVSETLIGTIGLHKIDTINQTAELGIVIGSLTHQGNGIGSEVIEAMCEHAFSVLNLRNITLRVLGNNPRALQCYVKCGFIKTGRLTEHIFKDGVWVDEIHMQLRRESFRVCIEDETRVRIAHIVKHSMP